MLIQKAKGQPPLQATFDKKSGNASFLQEIQWRSVEYLALGTFQGSRSNNSGTFFERCVQMCWFLVFLKNSQVMIKILHFIKSN